MKLKEVFSVRPYDSLRKICVAAYEAPQYVEFWVTPSEAERMAKLLINAAQRARAKKVKK